MTSGVTLKSSPTTLTANYAYVYGPASGTYTVTNLASVSATGNIFPGAIYLKNGGNLTNGSGGLVQGYGTNIGVAIVGAPGVVTNLGSISGGATGRGVELYDGGRLVNGSPSDTTASIIGHGTTSSAVLISGTTLGIPPGGTTLSPGGVGPASTVVNYGTIGGGNGRSGIAFTGEVSSATVKNGSTADTVAVITSGPSVGDGIYIGSSNGGSIANYATIGSANGRTGIGFGTEAGAGTVVNGSTVDHAALIISGSGTSSGVGVYFGSTHGGTVVNYATIGGASGGTGIDWGSVSGGGTVVNGSASDTTAEIIAGAVHGSGISGQSPTGPVDVTNFGTIQATAGSGIYLVGGGNVINGSVTDTTATIYQGGPHTGVYAKGGATTVTNYGMIGDTAGHTGISFGTSDLGSGTVVNGSTADTTALVVSGTTSGVGVYFGNAGGGIVRNFATIGGTAGRAGIETGTLAGGVTITNGNNADQTALITGGPGIGNGIQFNGKGPSEVVNFGTIAGTAGAAVAFDTGGTLFNGSSTDPNAVIHGYGTHSAIYVKAGASTIVNLATIGSANGGAGIGLTSLAGNAVVINGSTADTTAVIMGGTNAGTGIGDPSPGSRLTVENFGTISSSQENAVYLGGGGTLFNGSAGDTVAHIIGNTVHSAINAEKFATISNYGTISDPGPLHPIYTEAGALITNGSDSDTTALMTALGTGLHSQGTAAGLTLNNFGTISNTATVGSAVYTFGGTITNGSAADTVASISVGSAGYAIDVKGPLPGPITNFGNITGGDGIFFSTNAAGGVVVNAGTIGSSNGPSGYAILFNEPDGKVVDKPGAVFIGHVDAKGGGASVLELASGASTGTLSELGTYFTGFTNTTVDAGANWQLAGGNNLVGGDTLTVAGTLTTTGNLAGEGDVALDGGTASLGTNLGGFISVSMVDSTVNTLILPVTGGGTATNQINGFGFADRIELAGVTFDGGTVNGAAMDLTSGGGRVFTLENLAFAGGAVPRYFFGTDSTNGNSFVEVACFATGTQVLTAAGELPVEEMRAGMLVPSLAQARLMRVEWIGHREVNCAAHPRPLDVWPVRIAAHAFGPGQPHRDLVVSPDHAVAVPDAGGRTVLIPARHLVNGATIVQERRDSVGYFHVELQSHGVVVADGLAAEFFLDTGNRSAFANGGVAAMVHPEFARAAGEGAACAELVVDGPALEHARTRLAAPRVPTATNALLRAR